MRNPLLLVAVLLSLGGLALLLSRSDGPVSGGTERTVEGEDASAAEANEDLVAVEGDGDARTVESASPGQAQAAPEDAAPAGAPEDETKEVADLEAVRALKIRVVDAEGAPVMDARVWIGGHRTEAKPDTYFSYRGEEPSGTTDFDGRVDLEHFQWVTQDGRVSEVDLHVEHGDFVQYRDSVLMAEEERIHEVVLQRGGVVAVTAWIGDASRVVQSVTIEADRFAKVSNDDWEVEPSGRRVTDKFPPGRHRLRVTGTTADGGKAFSELVDFTILAGGYEELFVELRPASRFVGMVDPRVPRPIVDGVAVIGMHSLGPRIQLSLAHEQRVEIGADGEFVVEGLPAGDGQLVVLCRGWVSQKGTLPDRTGATPGGQRVGAWPPVSVPSDGTVTIPMEPTGSLEVTVVGPDGAPVNGAMVHVSPNYYFWGIGSQIVPGRDWGVRTGPDGRALLVDIPPDESEMISVRHETLQLTEAQRLETPRVEIRSGERSEVRFALEKKP